MKSSRTTEHGDALGCYAVKQRNKTAYDIRQDESIENSSLWISAVDYYDILIELQELQEKEKKKNNIFPLPKGRGI